jgi:hypothetical protein
MDRMTAAHAVFGCPLLDAAARDRWHIAGPIWAVRLPWSGCWMVLQINQNGDETVWTEKYQTRRAAVRAYWNARLLGRP